MSLISIAINPASGRDIRRLDMGIPVSREMEHAGAIALDAAMSSTQENGYFQHVTL